MTLKAIGVGGCFAPISVGNSNFLLEENGKKLMIDFGMTAPYILRDEMNVSLHELDLWCSHLHPDHSALSFFAFFRYFVPNAEQKIIKPTLYLNQSLVHPLWENSLKGDLESVHGKVLKLEDYFDLRVIQKNKSFMWQGAKFSPFQVTHVTNCLQVKPAYGIMIETKDNCLVITGDSVFSPDSLSYFYNKATIIFQDTEVGPRSRVHANWEDIRLLPKSILDKMFHYHYTKVPEDGDSSRFIRKGQVFDL